MTATDPPAIQQLLASADHVDRKAITSAATLREFVAGFLGYYPWWIKGLYQIRGQFVRLLGLRQVGAPQPARLQPAEVPMTAGAQAAFFTVVAAAPEHYWAAAATDTHLTAHLAVIATPAAGGQRRFEVLTIVHYHSWAGPVYFNIIRPFHHLVVGSMMRAAAQAAPAAEQPATERA